MATTKEYGLGEFTFPRGWFMVADSEELKDKPIPVRFFGQDFALYRGKSGRVVMLDAYCPHMGTHLARNETSYVVQDGSIEGDSIRCPYHGWRYGPDGKCNQIPYSTAPIPAAACVKSWTVAERIGCVFVWHDPEGGAPEWEAPDLPEWHDPSWVRWKIDHLGVLNSHPQEYIDNIADYAHLGPVHGSKVEYFENEFRGHLAIQRQGGGHRTLESSAGMLETDTVYHGPGFLLSHARGWAPNVIYIAHTPIDDGVTQVWHATLVKGQSGSVPPTPQDVAAARAYQAADCAAFAQDFDVWKYKRPCLNVLQVPGDGPFHKGRIWYKQFYNPRARKQEFLKQVEGVMHYAKGVAPAPRRETATAG
jgi:3-ketosteroid 9alpha-monooxygenase subunit A